MLIATFEYEMNWGTTRILKMHFNTFEYVRFYYFFFRVNIFILMVDFIAHINIYAIRDRNANLFQKIYLLSV